MFKSLIIFFWLFLELYIITSEGITPKMMINTSVKMFTTKIRLVLLMTTIFLISYALDQPPAPPKHYNIVLFGATGDLAQKYLWSGLFTLFKNEFIKGKVHFSIYGVGLTRQSDGRKAVGDILLKAIRCYDAQCRAIKTEFVQTVQYHALKTEEDYKELSDKMGENVLTQYGLKQNQTSYETGRLFFMSIPPLVVTKTVKRIKEHLLPQAGHPWVRIVLEKPFGRDKKSALKLASKLSDLFRDEQIYRVDHYLGKPVVRLILPFRYINRELYEHLWNRQHVERVEVVMKEKLGCAGRLNFYDNVGVVRDVMQNHLMELMLLVAMEMPRTSGNITEILAKKLEVLRQVRPIHKDGMLYGQYDGYRANVIEELQKPDYESLTPTFGATVLQIDNPRWQGVPFMLMSGKQLDVKSSYVRVLFKDDAFCVEEAPGVEACGAGRRKQVVFHIASGALHKPELILVSPGLPRPRNAQLWEHEQLNMDVNVFGEPMSDMHKLMPVANDDAYSSLLAGAFHGERHLFTTADILMASWDLWTPVVNAPITELDLRSYDVRHSLTMLNFKVNNRKLEFATPDPRESARQKTVELADDMAKGLTYLSHSMVGGSVASIVEKLAIDIAIAANNAVATRGVFHLAVSGGSSPVRLFKHLTDLDDELSLPWRQTHVWQVDERCVSSESIHSNFAVLNSYLLRHLPIPYHHIHPIPVHLREEPCQPADEAAMFYGTTIHRYLPDGEFDFILLGVGADGHTASLFPNHPSLKITNKMAVFSDGGPAGATSERVSLTFEAINRARRVGVLVTGVSKKAILKVLQEADATNVTEFPILGISPRSGNLTFYIDQAALSHG